MFGTFGVGIGHGYEYKRPNQPPVASGVFVVGTVQTGETITGQFSFSDENLDLQGLSVYQWYRADDADGSNATAIPGAINLDYTLQEQDEGFYICFEVTPVAQTGIITGTAVKSAYNGPVTPSTVNEAPVASTVVIIGALAQNEILTGNYIFSDNENDLEGTSTYKWYRSDDATGTGKTAIVGATGITYTIQAADLEKFISFEVTPVAQTGTTPGTPAESDYFGPVSYDSDSEAFFTASGITDSTIKAAHNTFVLALKNNSLWSKVWEFLPFVGGNSASHAVYGKNPSRSTVSWIGSPTHNSNGIKGNGSSQYGNLNWNPVTEGADVSNFGLGVYVKGQESNGTSRVYIGNQTASATNLTSFGWFNSGTHNGGYIAAATGSERVPSGTPSPVHADGFHFVRTTGSRVQKYLRNGTSLGTVTASGSFVNYPFFILAGNSAGSPGSMASVSVISFAIMTKGISDSEETILRNAITAYQTALGRA